MTIRAENGAEILLHVGIDTVGLAGEGFELHVREGQKVVAGDRLISFDLDLLAQRAKSLVTPVLVTDTTGFCVTRRSENGSLRVGDFLMEVVATTDMDSADAIGPHGAGVCSDGEPRTRWCPPARMASSSADCSCCWSTASTPVRRRPWPPWPRN